MKFTPHDHQTVAVRLAHDALNRGKKPLIILPTGTGKTCVAGMLALAEPGRVLIACCLVALIDQFYEDCQFVGISADEIGILQGDESDSQEWLSRCRVVIAMAQSLDTLVGASFLRSNKFELCIQDEKHLTWLDTAERLVNAPANIGMTATPWRGDGDESLLNGYEWIQPISLAETIALNINVDYEHYLYPEDIEDDVYLEPDYVFDEWAKHLWGIPTLAYCKTIEECEDYAEFFTHQGYLCATVCDTTHKDDFAAARRGLNDGSIHVVFSVLKTATGFNEKCAKGLMPCRRIGSLSLYVQIFGRILRQDGRGQIGKVLDFFNNGRRLPDPRDIKDWRDIPTAAGKTCKSCGLKNSTKALSCTSCGACLVTDKEASEIKDAFKNPIDLSDYRRLHKPLMKMERNPNEVLNHAGVAKAALQDAFWEYECDPAWAVKVQDTHFPDSAPIVYSQILEGAIFGPDRGPKELAVYLEYLNKFAGERSNPDEWMTRKIRAEFGQQGIDMLKIA